MKLSEQVCTLEQSARLKELGVENESVFNYARMGDATRLIWGNSDQAGGKHTHWVKIPAYTVAELGEMLPYEYLNHGAVENAAALNEANDGARVTVWRVNSGEWRMRASKGWRSERFPTEAQARAAFLIGLIENGIIPTPAP